MQTSLSEKAESICVSMLLYPVVVFQTGWEEASDEMQPVPCVHLNVHVVNVKEVSGCSGVGVKMHWTDVKITGEWGHCDDVVVFTKGEIVCESTIDNTLRSRYGICGQVFNTSKCNITNMSLSRGIHWREKANSVDMTNIIRQLVIA